MAIQIVGRREEQKRIKSRLKSKEAEFMAVYGRRKRKWVKHS